MKILGLGIFLFTLILFARDQEQYEQLKELHFKAIGEIMQNGHYLEPKWDEMKLKNRVAASAKFFSPDHRVALKGEVFEVASELLEFLETEKLAKGMIVISVLSSVENARQSRKLINPLASESGHILGTSVSIKITQKSVSFDAILNRWKNYAKDKYAENFLFSSKPQLSLILIDMNVNGDLAYLIDAQREFLERQ